ncbi:MAG: citrate synthase [Planctomycetota bacterium]|nr:MAG: citrate synthase [Planctomycetota bacterium]
MQYQGGTAPSTATGQASLSLIDGRTGQSYSLSIQEGAIRAAELRNIKVSEDDFGLMSYDPAFANTAACRSAITYIDGDRSVLDYRGYPIEQIAEHATHLEVACLLLKGELPAAAQLQQFIAEVTAAGAPPDGVRKLFEAMNPLVHPMAMLMAGLAALGGEFPKSAQVENPEQRWSDILRLLAYTPILAGWAYRRRLGLPFVEPDPALSYAGNILRMLKGEAGKPYRPDPKLERALDVLLILHADHEQNCSTSTVRGVGSSRVDPYSAVAAGVAALYGPLHGGANQAVLEMLEEVGSVANVAAFVQSCKDGHRRLMGFGHRVYKSYDPRAAIITRLAEQVFEVTGQNPKIRIARELEKIALNDPYFIKRKLYPNVDFYSGCIYEAMGFDVKMFTVFFALGRMCGWLAHWDEMIRDPEQKIARPRQIYTGPARRDYVRLEQR